jgi:ADP-ribose pyrophosphatase YjhB (NUDIX family)
VDIPCVGAIVRDRDGRILVVRRGRPPGERLWSIPGGRVEAGETDAEAVVREVLEETGLVVDVEEQAGSAILPALQPGDRYQVTDYFAHVRAGESMHPIPGDDAFEARWVTASEFLTLDLTPGLADTLAGWNIWSRPNSSA